MFFLLFFLSFLRVHGEEGPNSRPYTFKETRNVEIFIALGRSSKISLSQGLKFLVRIARNWRWMLGGVTVSLPPGVSHRASVLLKVVRKKERDI